MKKLDLLWPMAILLLLQSVCVAQSYTGRLGVEAHNDVFVDIVKQGYRWDKSDGAGGWIAQTSTDVDASGWPNTDARFIMDFRPVAEWAGTIDDPDVYRINRSGVYKGSFEGQATLTRIEGPFTITNQAYNATSNVTTFDLTVDPPGPHHGLMVFSFTATKKTPSSATGTGLKNFKLIRPGYAANTTQVFTNAFISTLTSARFSTIRFMGVTNTNNNVEWGPTNTLLQGWTNRKKTTDASQDAIPTLNKKDGWAWEYVIQLCNQANMDMWINIPVSVDDNYITQLATLVKNNLNSNLNIYIEHTNELWNFGFLQYSWNKARATEEVNAGGSNFNYDGSTDAEIWNQRRHAKRVRDAVTLFGNVFGAGSINTRIRGILAGITPDPNGFFIGGRLPGMLQYLNANYGAPKNYIYAISIPLYYGGEAASGNGNTGNFTPQQIIDAMRTTSDNDVPNRQSFIALANTWQLPGGPCSYEGGPDIGGGNATNIANRIRAVRDPAQKDVYKRNFATNFWDLGGKLAMQFTLASSYNRYGAWGLTDDLNNPDRNSLFQAVRELIGSGGTGPGTGTGLRGEYYNNPTLTTPIVLTRTDATVNFTWGSGSPAPGTVNTDWFSVRWTGQVEAPVSGNYTFTTVSDDGVRLWVNGVQVINNWTDHPATTNNSAPIALTAGQKYSIKMEYYENGGQAVARLLWTYPGQAQQAIPQSRLYPATGVARTGLVDELVQQTVSNKAFSVYPNPVHANTLTASLYSNSKAPITIHMLTLNGQKLTTIKKTLNQGANTIQIPVARFKNGSYLLVAEKDNERIIQKIIIQR